MGQKVYWHKKAKVTAMCRVKSRKMSALAVPLAACLALSACASSDNSTYDTQDVGQIIETSQGQVISSREVEIRDTDSGIIGAAGGGITGGVVGSTMGSGGGNTLATLAGVLIGVGIGYLTEQELRSGKGIEYMVEMDDGRVVTIVQNHNGEDPAIPNSTPVLIQYGSEYTRIVPMEKNTTSSLSSPPSSPPPGDEWQNPDLAPAEAPNGSEDVGVVVQTETWSQSQ